MDLSVGCSSNDGSNHGPPSIAKYPATSPPTAFRLLVLSTHPHNNFTSLPTDKPPLLSTHLFTQFEMAIAPIIGKLKRGLIIDLCIATGFGTSMGYLFWYGYHVPAVRHRDLYQAKLERLRLKNAQ